MALGVPMEHAFAAAQFRLKSERPHVFLIENGRR